MEVVDDTHLCLDTSVLIAFLKGREPGASAVERAIQNRTCHVTAITVYELLFGMAFAQKQIGEETLLDVMDIVPFDDAAARRAASLHPELIRRNDDIGVKDVLIAAICLDRSLPLLTLNERHFSRVTGLRVLTPDALLAEHS
ncbi:MAG: type II toxin-antitoxin system VapC family toxin [Anaerolineae bacterium]|nr:type II toxin-antitoxin system VapC family toxin [Anaerolineae bacterium]